MQVASIVILQFILEALSDSNIVGHGLGDEICILHLVPAIGGTYEKSIAFDDLFVLVKCDDSTISVAVRCAILLLILQTLRLPVT